MTTGLSFDANVNKAFINFELSPYNLFSKTEGLQEMNIPFSSLAIAFANIVFPVPGSPYNIIPFGGENRGSVVFIDAYNKYSQDIVNIVRNSVSMNSMNMSGSFDETILDYEMGSVQIRIYKKLEESVLQDCI